MTDAAASAPDPETAPEPAKPPRVRPETAALISAALDCISWFYAASRAAAQMRECRHTVYQMVEFDAQHNEHCIALVAALEPFGKGEVGAAIGRADKIVERIRKARLS